MRVRDDGIPSGIKTFAPCNFKYNLPKYINQDRIKSNKDEFWVLSFKLPTSDACGECFFTPLLSPCVDI